jgi:hypothetical protein
VGAARRPPLGQPIGQLVEAQLAQRACIPELFVAAGAERGDPANLGAQGCELRKLSEDRAIERQGVVVDVELGLEHRPRVRETCLVDTGPPTAALAHPPHDTTPGFHFMVRVRGVARGTNHDSDPTGGACARGARGTRSRGLTEAPAMHSFRRGTARFVENGSDEEARDLFGAAQNDHSAVLGFAAVARKQHKSGALFESSTEPRVDLLVLVVVVEFDVTGQGGP